VFNLARWAPAEQDAQINYNYCTKEGNFELIGDFSKESGVEGDKMHRPPSIPMILSALADPVMAVQVKVYKGYADRALYFDRTSAVLSRVSDDLKWFAIWKHRFLYPWQFTILKMVMNQPKREVLWVCDTTGNSGKTFLAHYLSVLYGFQMLDGTLSSRDLGHMLSGDAKGFVTDVTRASLEFFDYSVIENLKNGHLITGKYGGKIRRFADGLPMVVFSNQHPDVSKLSQDRWRILKIGEGDLSDTSKTAIIQPAALHPFIEPTPMPDMTENFDLRTYMTERMPQYRVPAPLVTVVRPVVPHPAAAPVAPHPAAALMVPRLAAPSTTGVRVGTSQIAEMSTTAHPVAANTIPQVPRCRLHPNQGK
jgi:hypothetical protein